MTDGPTSAEAPIWERARGGDPAAFASIFDLHRDKVYAQAYRRTLARHDAEDVLAMVFFEAWRSRTRVRLVNGSIAAWLLVTTNHVSQNVTRSLRRHRIALARIPARDTVDDHAPIVLDSLDRDATAELVRAAFAKLKPRDQDVLTLCVVNEYSLEHAASALGVPVGTVKSRLSRAKSRLALLTGAQRPDDANIPFLGGAR